MDRGRELGYLSQAYVFYYNAKRWSSWQGAVGGEKRCISNMLRCYSKTPRTCAHKPIATSGGSWPMS
jgi:hypothetical protein